MESEERGEGKGGEGERGKDGVREQKTYRLVPRLAMPRIRGGRDNE